jgi:GNAT superfamily N-acetyltransferase
MTLSVDTRRYRIRPARNRDAHGIAEVHVASWRAAYRDILPAEFLDRLSVAERETQHRDQLTDPTARSGVLVVELSGILGFASFAPSRDDDAMAQTGEVTAIYLHPDVIGTGTGRHLFAETVRALEETGFARATLWVLEANTSARRFYEKAGWAWDGSVGTHMFDCANEPVVRYAVDL